MFAVGFTKIDTILFYFIYVRPLAALSDWAVCELRMYELYQVGAGMVERTPVRILYTRHG